MTINYFDLFPLCRRQIIDWCLSFPGAIACFICFDNRRVRETIGAAAYFHMLTCLSILVAACCTPWFWVFVIGSFLGLFHSIWIHSTIGPGLCTAFFRIMSISFFRQLTGFLWVCSTRRRCLCNFFRMQCTILPTINTRFFSMFSIITYLLYSQFFFVCGMVLHLIYRNLLTMCCPIFLHRGISALFAGVSIALFPFLVFRKVGQWFYNMAYCTQTDIHSTPLLGLVICRRALSMIRTC